MGVSQYELERIAYDVADEFNFHVEVQGTDIYFTYTNARGKPVTRHIYYYPDSNTWGINGTLLPLEHKPPLFMDRVCYRIEQLLNE